MHSRTAGRGEAAETESALKSKNTLLWLEDPSIFWGFNPSERTFSFFGSNLTLNFFSLRIFGGEKISVSSTSINPSSPFGYLVEKWLKFDDALFSAKKTSLKSLLASIYILEKKWEVDFWFVDSPSELALSVAYPFDADPFLKTEEKVLFFIGAVIIERLDYVSSVSVSEKDYY